MFNKTQAYYNIHANEYFQATSNLILKAQWDILVEHLRPGAKILDLGSGSGRDLSYFSAHGFQVLGMDYALNLLKLSQTLTDQPLVVGNMVALPFQDQCFDAVWSIGTLLHIAPNVLPTVLIEIHRVLKPGAYLFASVKKGRGRMCDLGGRETFLHEVQPWKRLLQRLDFQIESCNVTIEPRQRSSGEVQRIEWIESLARTSTK
jgi:ubiquinone/menaquinone biosynthesis C-methylase UbiE